MLDRILGEHMDEFFPLVTYRVRSDDPPWMTHGLRDKIEKRKEIYATDQKRTARWKKMKELTDKLVLEKKTELIESLKAKAIEQGSTAKFYKAVRLFKDDEKPARWNLRDLFPEDPDAMIVEEVADFFNKISQEFEPISP